MASALVSRRSRTSQIAVWVVCVLLTVIMLAYQRMTGPTYPKAVHETLGGASVSGKLVRTHAGEGGAVVAVEAPDPGIGGTLVWRKYPTNDAWTAVPLRREGATLTAELPHMPVAGKLEYTLRVGKGPESVVVPRDGAAIIRYRNDVPAWVLIPHILCMFVGLLIGLRILAGAVLGESEALPRFRWLMAFMLPGGLILGPLVQKFAFDAYWTGWPVGEDLTDTKTLVACVAWAIAWWLCVKKPSLSRLAIILAAAVMLAVYLIPHSVRGSQYDWSKTPSVAQEQR